MRKIVHCISKLKDISDSVCIEALGKPETQRLISQALEQTECHQMRQCPLPPNFMVWLVILMGLCRKDSIEVVLRRVLGALRGRFPDLSLQAVTDGAVSHARRRVGVEPFRVLFRLLADTFVSPPSFHGWRVRIIDGTTFSMPDTPENTEHFGKPGHKSGEAAFPRLTFVGLMDWASRRFMDFRVLPWKGSEYNASRELVSSLEEGDLLLADRGFYSVRFICLLLQRKVGFLIRIRKGHKVKIKKRLGPGEAIGWITGLIPKEELHVNPRYEVVSVGSVYARVRFPVRIFTYRIGERESVRLITNLVETPQIPVEEWANLYRCRWDIEIAYDEIKTHLAQAPTGTSRTHLRSKSQANVEQEVHGLFIAYNLVRSVMVEAAEEHGIVARDIGFVAALKTIELSIPGFSRARDAWQLITLYKRLLSDVAQCLNTRPRRNRSYPRVVRVNQSRWACKKPRHKQKKICYADLIRLEEAA